MLIINPKEFARIFSAGSSALHISKALLAVPLMGLSAAVFGADLALDFQDSPNIGPAGGVFTYSLALQNNGPEAAGNATGITTSFNMPVTGGSTYGQYLTYRLIDGTGTCAYNPGPQTVTCSGLSALAFNQLARIEIDVRLPTAGTYNSQASAASTGVTPDTNQGNNSAPQVTTAQAASDLQVNAASNAAAGIQAGQPYAYQLEVVNNGPDAMPADSKTRVTFEVPSGASVTGRPSGNGWTCLPGTGYPLSNNELITCDRGTPLANGAVAPVITVPAVSNTDGSVSASFQVKGLQQNNDPVPDGNASNDIDSVSLIFDSGTDLAIVKARTAPAGNGAVAQGGPVTYTLTPSHQGGQQPAGTITVTDTLGAGLSFAAPTAFTAGNGWSCGTAGSVLTCTRPGWSGGNFSNMPQIQVNAVADGLGTLANTAEIAFPEDSNPSNNISAVSINSSNEADIVTTKGGPNYPVTLGETFNYTLSARNVGPLAVSAAQTIRVTDPLPAGIERIGPLTASAPWNCDASTPTTIDCSRPGPLGVGATAPLITVPVRATAAGSLLNTACSELNGPAVPVDNTANNCTGQTTRATVEAADLAILKTADKNDLRTGDLLTYTLQVTNNGPDESTNVTVADNLTSLLPGAGNGGLQSVAVVPAPVPGPEHLDGLGCRIGDSGPYSPNLGAFDGGSQNLRCNLGTLSNGASSTITIVVKPLVATNNSRNNTATVTSPDVGDGDRSNNSSTNSINSVTALVDIQALKTRPSPTIAAGAPLRFTASVRNAGPSTASGVELIDTLPSNAPFLRLISDDGGNCEVPAVGSTGGTLKCAWATVPNNNTRNVVYELRALAEGDVINNAVVVSTTTEENDVLSNTATTSTTVSAAVLDVVVNKSDNPNVVDLGQTSLYTISIDNGGPSAATGLTMVDTFPVNSPGGEAPTAVFSYQGDLRVYKGGNDVTGNAAEYSCTEPGIGVSSGVLTCTFPGYIDSGSAEQRTVTYRMRAESVSGVAGVAVGSSHNQVAVSVNETETQLDNNRAVETTSARRSGIATDLGGTKTAGAGALVKGGNVSYSITVTNNGGAESIGAQVIDPLPAGMEYVSSTPVGACANASGTVTCQVGALAAGQSKTFTIISKLDAGFTGRKVVNTAQIDAPGDTDPGNNNPSVETPVIDKSVGAPTLSHLGLLMLTMLLSLVAWRARRT